MKLIEKTSDCRRMSEHTADFGQNHADQMHARRTINTKCRRFKL